MFVFVKPMCKVVYMKTSGHTIVADYCLLLTVDSIIKMGTVENQYW